MASWKRLLLISASFGAGLAVLLSLIFWGVLWYQQLPKEWNKSAIMATYDGLDTEGKEKTFVFYYTLENNTKSDYSFMKGSDVVIMAKLKEQKSLSGGLDDLLTVDSPIFLPSKQRLRFPIHLKYYYKGKAVKPDADSEGRKKYRKELEAYVKENFTNLDGFVLFDKESRYQIEFPRGW